MAIQTVNGEQPPGSKFIQQLSLLGRSSGDRHRHRLLDLPDDQRCRGRSLRNSGCRLDEAGWSRWRHDLEVESSPKVGGNTPI
jgi:hypothetical protein